MTSRIDVRPAFGCLFFCNSHELVRVCEIKKKLSHMGKNNRIPNLVCEQSNYQLYRKTEGWPNDLCSYVSVSWCVI